MVTIGTGRDDPRRWVQAAYLLLDTVEGGGTGPQGKLPARAEIAAKLGVQRATITRAYRELTARGIIHLVPGCGYFASKPGAATIADAATESAEAARWPA